MWIVYALIAGITTALGGLLSKKAVIDIEDSWMRSFYFSFFVAIISLPFFLYELSIPSTAKEIVLIVVLSAVIVASNYLTFKSYNYLGPLAVNVLGKLKLVWIAVIGFVFLNQVLSLRNVSGMIAIIAASLVIVDYHNWKSNKEGVYAIVLATITFAGFAFLTTILSRTIKPFSLLFYITLIPAIFNALLIPDVAKKFRNTINKTKIMIASAVTGAIMNLSLIIGVSEEPTKFFFLMETGIILIILGEYFWLKDKKHIALKILGILLAVAGAVLLR